MSLQQIKNMKRILTSLILFSILALPVVALAQSPDQLPEDVQNILNRTKTAVYTVFGAVAVICFMYAGFLFVTAAGNPEQIKKAKTALHWGFFGTIIGILSASIVSVLKTWRG